MTDSFAHQLRIGQIRDGDRLNLSADEGECRAIAKRLGLDSLDRLEAHVTLSVKGQIVRASGRLVGALDQSCVVTREPVPALIDEPFEVMFVPEAATRGPDDEIELAAADCDTVFHDGAIIDLGSAIADTLALSLDPYPRSAGADAALKEAGIFTEAEAGPFAALAKLKRGEDS
jgi:uncharacterized metal-binding protein YceD (DUF177 family)